MINQQNNPQTMPIEEEIDLSHLFNIFKKYYLVFILSLLVFLGIGVIFQKTQQNLYEAKITVVTKSLERDIARLIGTPTSRGLFYLIAKNPSIYKETALRLLAQDLEKKVNIPGIDKNNRAVIINLIKKKLDELKESESYFLAPDNAQEFLLSNLLTLPSYNGETLEKNCTIAQLKESPDITDLTYKSPAIKDTVKALNIIAKIATERYNLIYWKKEAETVLPRLNQDKLRVESELIAIRNTIAELNSQIQHAAKKEQLVTVQKVIKNPRVTELEKKIAKTTDPEEEKRLRLALDQEVSTIWKDEKVKYIDPVLIKLVEEKRRTELQYNKLKTDLATLNKYINYYSQRFPKDITQGAEVISYAKTAYLSTSFKYYYILALGAVWFFLTTGFVLFLESLHINISHFEKSTGKNIIGLFPKVSIKAACQYELDHICENIAKESFKSFTISAAYADSGKTLITLNIAKHLARVFNKKVLLVDANHDNPKIHKYLKMNNNYGFSNLITEDIHNIKQGLHSPTNLPNFFVLFFGTADRNTHLANVSNKELLDNFIKKLAGHFDYIIFSSPTISSLNLIEFMPSEAKNLYLVQDASKSLSNYEIRIYNELQNEIKGLK
ncbi:MAG: AAA family ATPase [Candidatus Margulisbacteria bacterium]|nr:AAA family ATPase [Candidatus Margulisiibacteriota bacterium]